MHVIYISVVGRWLGARSLKSHYRSPKTGWVMLIIIRLLKEFGLTENIFFYFLLIELSRGWMVRVWTIFLEHHICRILRSYLGLKT